MALIGANKFKAKLDRVAIAAEKKKLWGQIGFQAIDTISQRTLAGKDVRGRPFTAYDKKYAKWKKKRGGEFFTGVNLHDSGNMFGSMKAKSTAKNTTLFFSKPLEGKKAFIHHKGIGKMPKREFFDLSSMEKKELMSLMVAELKKAAR